MNDCLSKYIVKIPDSVKADNCVDAYELQVHCLECNCLHTLHLPNEFSDVTMLACLCCGREKWIPLYGDYGLSGFKMFFSNKYKLPSHMLRVIELASLYDACFESYCEICPCGGRFKKISEPVCIKCGTSNVIITNSTKQYWRDDAALITSNAVEWIRYYEHPF